MQASRMGMQAREAGLLRCLPTLMPARASTWQVYYPNVYDHEVTFEILVEEGGDILSVKEKEVTVPARDKAPIIVRFVHSLRRFSRALLLLLSL